MSLESPTDNEVSSQTPDIEEFSDIIVPYDKNFVTEMDDLSLQLVVINDDSVAAQNLFGLNSKATLSEVTRFIKSARIYVSDGSSPSTKNFLNKRDSVRAYTAVKFDDASTSLFAIDLSVADILCKRNPKTLIITSKYLLYIAHKLKLMGCEVTTIIEGIFRNVEDLDKNVSVKDALVESRSIRNVKRVLDDSITPYIEKDARALGVTRDEHDILSKYTNKSKNIDNTASDSEEDITDEADET